RIVYASPEVLLHAGSYFWMYLLRKKCAFNTHLIASAKNGLSLCCNCCTRDSRYARDKLTNVRRAGVSRDSGDSPHSPREGLPSLLSPAVAASPPSLPSPRPTTQPAQASMLPFALHDIPPGVPPRCTPLSLPDTARCLLPELTTTRHGKKPKW